MMQRLTAADFHPEVLRLFDRYVHGLMARADFIDAAGRFAAAGQTGLTLLQALSPNFEAGTQVVPADPRIQASFADFDSPSGHGRLRGYLVKPVKGAGKLPGVLVCHENRGLNPHIEDIARRVALEGFIAFAPDALSPLGGYPGEEDKAREMFATLERSKVQLDFLAAAQYFRTLPELNGRYGATGFCFGGGVVNFLTTRLPDLGAAVPFYGGAAPTADVSKIRAPLLIHFAEHDERINAQWPAYEAALKAAGIPYEAHVYPGTQHGFNNDTTPRYDAAAAALAWERTIAFFNTHLRTN
jgi:carboxymethylenebutenolidase